MEKITQMAPNWARRIFPTNPDLADILGDTDFDFENVHFLDVLDPRFPGSRFPNFQMSRFPDFQITKFPDFQVPRFPDAAGAGADDEL